jgi:predicted PurR-regulated permease PerM
VNGDHLPPPRLGPLHSGAWSPATRDRSFLVVFAASLVAVFVVFGPFLDALILASAVVVVTWPLFESILAVVGSERRYGAAGLTTGVVVLLILVPVGLLLLWVVQEAALLIQHLVELARAGVLRTQVEELVLEFRIPGQERLNEVLGTNLDLIALVVEPLQGSVVSLGEQLARNLPNLVGTLLGATLDTFVFVFAVVSLYAEGPRVLKAAGRLSPLKPEYHSRLFDVFREFSTNLVLGALTTATVQALIATIGFAIASVPNLVLVGLLTAMFSFIPIVGTSLVWVPVAIWTGVNYGWGWGLFVFVWNASLTGTVDNVLRPLLLRGRSPIHPLPIFLSVLGGLYWLGLPGALVGPVLVAVWVAMYRIWTEELAEQGIQFPDATPAPVSSLDYLPPSSSSSSSSSMSASSSSASSMMSPPSSPASPSSPSHSLTPPSSSDSPSPGTAPSPSASPSTDSTGGSKLPSSSKSSSVA